MKVKTLKEFLNLYPEDMEVVGHDVEDRFAEFTMEITNISEICGKICLTIDY